jgi:hypothetical protein
MIHPQRLYQPRRGSAAAAATGKCVKHYKALVRLPPRPLERAYSSGETAQACARAAMRPRKPTPAEAHEGERRIEDRDRGPEAPIGR